MWAWHLYNLNPLGSVKTRSLLVLLLTFVGGAFLFCVAFLK